MEIIENGSQIKKNTILKSAGIETKDFLKPNNCKVVKFVNISQRRDIIIFEICIDLWTSFRIFLYVNE